MRITLYIVLEIMCCTTWAQAPQGFVDLSKLDSSIAIEMRYFSDWNFIGRKVEGYAANKCYLTEVASRALAKAQKEFQKRGYGLLVFDCYRPQRAVAQFAAWAKDPSDLKMQKMFYPTEAKDQLFQRGYIASKSGHSRGSTVDLTLIRVGERSKSKTGLLYKESFQDCRGHSGVVQTGQIDMGTSYDCFSELANTDDPHISEDARTSRALLKTILEKVGFENYKKEWWHYTFKQEPFKDKYFDFVIN